MFESAQKTISAAEGSLFVWRNTVQFDGGCWGGLPPVELPKLYRPCLGDACPHCRTLYEREEDTSLCPLCGFWHSYHFHGGSPDEPTYDQATREVALLKKLEINSAELALHELGSHLKRRFRDIYFLRTQRFEELVADIYRQQGFHTRLTKQSRDGGYDIVVVEQSSGLQAIVERKRYACGRLVTVQHVRQLLGVQLRLGIPQGSLVCTSGYTRPAQKLAAEINSGPSGFRLSLLDMHDLLSALDVYNTRLPALNVHPSFRTTK